MVTFNAVTAAAWRDLDAADRRRAALLWEFAARERPIDELLARTARFAVVDGTRPLGTWWQYGDAGLLFDPDGRVIGQAIQWGFVCGDRALWAAIASAPSLPPTFSWELDDAEEDDPVPDLWSPPDERVDAIVGAAAATSATRS